MFFLFQECFSLLCVLVIQSCLTFCNPMDCSPPGSSVHGILQARILEWVVILFSRGLPNPGIELRSQVSRIAGSFFTVWTTREAQEYWSGYSIPSPGEFPNPGIKPGPPTLQADSLLLSYQGLMMSLYQRNTAEGGESYPENSGIIWKSTSWIPSLLSGKSGSQTINPS